MYTTPIIPLETLDMTKPKTKEQVSPTGKVRVNVLIQANVLKATKALAQRRGTTYSEVIRTAVRSYVVAELNKEKEQGNSAN